MNPAKPVVFPGLQEMLVYFDPWIAGVVMPTLIILGLMVIPYMITNPSRRLLHVEATQIAIGTFLFGFIILWVSMIFIGTSSAAPDGNGFWPARPGTTTASSMR